MKDLTIGAQLRLGLGVLLAVVLAQGLLAYWQAQELWRQTDHLYNTSLVVGEAIDDLHSDVLLVRGELRSYLLADGEEARSAALQGIETGLADSERQLSLLERHYTGPREDLGRLRDTFTRWRALHAENRELARAGRRAEALVRIDPPGDIGLLRVELFDGLTSLRRFWRSRADRAFREAEAERDSVLQATVAAAAAALALALLVLFTLTRTLRVPLHELTLVVDRLRRGERDARSGYRSRSEIGVLAAAFDEMAESLEGQARLDRQAAELAGLMLSETEARRFCRGLLLTLAEQTGSEVGAIYLLDRAKAHFERLESVGMGEGGPDRLAVGSREGEIGAALAARRLLRIEDIPEDTPFTFAAAGGTFRPREILAAPLEAGGETVAILSLASLRPYPPSAVRLLETVLGTAAARTAGVLAFREIQELAARLEQQNAELQAQKEELQRQHEELTAQGEELRQQSEELQEQNVELDRQHHAVAESSRLKSAFLSSVSHELRTPLNSVLVLSHLLREQASDRLTEEQRGYLDIMQRNGKRLLTLINEVLDLAKIQAGRLALEPRSFSALAAVDAVVAELTPLAQAKGLALDRELPSSLPSIESDEARLAQILQNLLGNAIKFTDEGRVTVALRREGETLQVAVTDTGIGIPADELPYIFDEFRQVDGSSTRRHEGTGLGLAIARKTARLLGGDVAVASTPGAGSTFTLTLPLAWPRSDVPERSAAADLPDAPAPAPAAPPPAPAPRHAAGSRRVLLVEDDETAVLQIRGALEDAGYLVEVARGGKQAGEAAQRAAPDAMVLDLMMPDVDGFAVLEEIRAAAATADLPVLVLTARDLGPDDLRRLRDGRVEQLARKGDVDRAQLLARVAALLDRKPCILLVEDHPDNLATARALLQARYRVLEARDGEAALRIAAEARPDLILLDIGLPKLDGTAVARALERDPALRAIPVIAVTAQAMKGDRERLLAAGCDDYVAKPLAPEVFLQTIARWLERGRS